MKNFNSNQQPLFENIAVVGYPYAPAYRALEASKEAADKVASSAEANRQRALEVLKTGNYTADEIGDKLGLDDTSIRPRCSELFKMNKIAPVIENGKVLKRKNKKENNMTVWRKV